MLLCVLNYMDNMGNVFIPFVQQNALEMVKNKYTRTMVLSFLFHPKAGSNRKGICISVRDKRVRTIITTNQKAENR
jgi:hypothetical protein